MAVLRDDRTHQMLLQQGFIENKNLYVVNNTYSLLKLLVLRQNIDLILADTINVTYRAIFHELEPELFKSFYKLDKPPSELYLACSINTSSNIVAMLADAITTIKSNGQYKEISRRWMSKQNTFGALTTK